MGDEREDHGIQRRRFGIFDALACIYGVLALVFCVKSGAELFGVVGFLIGIPVGLVSMVLAGYTAMWVFFHGVDALDEILTIRPKRRRARVFEDGGQQGRARVPGGGEGDDLSTGSVQRKVRLEGLARRFRVLWWVSVMVLVVGAIGMSWRLGLSPLDGILPAPFLIFGSACLVAALRRGSALNRGIDSTPEQGHSQIEPNGDVSRSRCNRHRGPLAKSD